MNLPNMPEAILRQVWQEQSFSCEHLATADGRPVRILLPGTSNSDGGPDFLHARIAIGSITFHGDVELHINAEQWLAHNHDSDPHYNKVILHVVLTADPLSPPARTASRRSIPLLVLHPFLDETFHRAWTRAIIDEHPSTTLALACAEVNENVPAKIVHEWIERLARERIELKVRRHEERLKQLVDETRHIIREPYPRYYGSPDDIPHPQKEFRKKDFTDKSMWEQLVYEGVMEALGYAKNTQPFLALARSMRLTFLRNFSLHDPQAMQALLFGAAGLLPPTKQIISKESRAYVAELRKKWKSLRPSFKGELLHEGDWLFFRLRPNNFPTARLAALCCILPKLFGETSFRNLIGVFKTEALTTKERLARLHGLFAFEPDEFWKQHFHFKGKRRSQPDPDEPGSLSARNGIALGTVRINDILINTIIPVVLLYARLFNDNASRASARSVLSALPASQDNAITDIVQQQLVKNKGSLSSSLLQQGAIQLYRFYCSPLRCTECAIGRRTSIAQSSS